MARRKVDEHNSDSIDGIYVSHREIPLPMHYCVLGLQEYSDLTDCTDLSYTSTANGDMFSKLLNSHRMISCHQRIVPGAID